MAAITDPVVWLVIPCYNEASRLDMAAFVSAKRALGLRFLFVDDGSTDGTAAIVSGHVDDHLQLLRLDHNRGKADAVRQGVLRLAQAGQLEPQTWVGFWDADLSTPLDDVARFLAFERFSGRAADAIIGSRVALLGSRITRRASRHAVGRLIATCATAITGLRAYDSQCGAKLFRLDAARAAFAEPFACHWLFDIEVLLRVGPDRVLECPVSAWTHRAGGNMRVIRDGWRTARDLFRLWRRYGGVSVSASRPAAARPRGAPGGTGAPPSGGRTSDRQSPGPP